jgi:hypothetical protein
MGGPKLTVNAGNQKNRIADAGSAKKLSLPAIRLQKIWEGPSGPRPSAADCRFLRFAPPMEIQFSRNHHNQGVQRRENLALLGA